MIEWVILIGVKLLKAAIFGVLAFASQVTSSECCRVEATASVEAVAPLSATAVAEFVPGCTGPVERVGRMVPPVRVEVTFTPDLLVPPRRDLSL